MEKNGTANKQQALLAHQIPATQMTKVKGGTGIVGPTGGDKRKRPTGG